MLLARKVNALEIAHDRIEKVVEGYGERIDQAAVSIEDAIAHISSLSVRRALERTPIPIPPAPKCLYENGLL